MQIPADENDRQIDIVRFASAAPSKLPPLEPINPENMTRGGERRWEPSRHNIGHLGFQDGAYAVDMITLPESTPWNTWFRTSAIYFFPDGRMVVTTVGGDIWIVSGVDDDLLVCDCGPCPDWRRAPGVPMAGYLTLGATCVLRLESSDLSGSVSCYCLFPESDDCNSCALAFLADRLIRFTTGI